MLARASAPAPQCWPPPIRDPALRPLVKRGLYNALRGERVRARLRRRCRSQVLPAGSGGSGRSLRKRRWCRVRAYPRRAEIIKSDISPSILHCLVLELFACFLWLLVQICLAYACFFPLARRLVSAAPSGTSRIFWAYACFPLLGALLPLLALPMKRRAGLSVLLRCITRISCAGATPFFRTI